MYRLLKVLGRAWQEGGGGGGCFACTKLVQAVVPGRDDVTITEGVGDARGIQAGLKG
jgi:hypothetical protein